MKNTNWIIGYLLIVGVHLTGIALDHQLIEYVTKPMLVAYLFVFFLLRVGKGHANLKKWILAALAFSWIGDVLLMFQEKNANFFLAGLGSFLLAHIFYIVFFHIIRIRENIKSNAWMLILVVVYYALLLSLLSPYLGDMKLAVRIYGLVISFMFMLAMHMLYLRDKQAGRWMIAGATFFVLSDTILAINKFYQPFSEAGILIMLTYALAQLFLVLGALRFLGNPKS